MLQNHPSLLLPYHQLGSPNIQNDVNVCACMCVVMLFSRSDDINNNNIAIREVAIEAFVDLYGCSYRSWS